LVWFGCGPGSSTGRCGFFLALEVVMSSTADLGIGVANAATQAVYWWLYSPAGVRWLDEWRYMSSATPEQTPDRTGPARLARELLKRSYGDLPYDSSPIYQLCLGAVSDVDFDLIARVVLSESESS
jgi:hypothetical protein